MWELLQRPFRQNRKFQIEYASKIGGRNIWIHIQTTSVRSLSWQVRLPLEETAELELSRFVNMSMQIH